MQELQTVSHVRTLHKSPLDVELATRALRNAVWLAIFLSQDLRWESLTDALTRVLMDIDRQLEEIDRV